MKKLMIVLACLDVLVLALLLMGYPQRWFLPENGGRIQLKYTVLYP